jgi:hypothetical protein
VAIVRLAGRFLIVGSGHTDAFGTLESLPHPAESAMRTGSTANRVGPEGETAKRANPAKGMKERSLLLLAIFAGLRHAVAAVATAAQAGVAVLRDGVPGGFGGEIMDTAGPLS